MEKKTISEVIYEIKKRPGLYLGIECISSLNSFITGYTLGGGLTPEDGELLNDFQRWIEKRYNAINTVKGWTSIILFDSANDHKALYRFFELFDEYLLQKDKV